MHHMDAENSTVEYGPTNRQDHDDLWLEEVLVPSLFAGMCFAVGVPGNGLVIWTILCRIPQRSLTVMLLLHLAIADFIVLITLPLWIHSFSDQWVYGLFGCRFLTYIICFTMYASVFFLTAMSIQRFTAVVFPFSSRSWQKKESIYGTVLSIWVLALLMASPAFIFRTTSDTNGTILCNDWVYSNDQQELADLLVELVMCFLVPFSIMIVCYTLVIRRIRRMKFQRKSKSGKLIVSVVVAFFVCWIPYHILNVLLISGVSLRSSNPDMSRTLENIVKAGENISNVLVFVSSCLNPILYAFAARSFRGGLRGTNFEKLFGEMNDDTGEKVPKNQHISSTTTEVSLPNRISSQ